MKFEDETHHAPKGSTWYGEVVGDTAAFFAFLGVQRYMPVHFTDKPVNAACSARPLAACLSAPVQAWHIKRMSIS